jgi:hypothetical protein
MRRLAAALIAVVVPLSPLVATITSAGTGSQSSSGGDMNGEACSSYRGDPKATCDTWEAASPENVLAWQDSDHRDGSGQGSSHAEGSIGFEEQRDSSGRFLSATASGHFKATSHGGAEAAASGSYYFSITPDAPLALTVTGSATAEASGGELVLSIANVDVKLSCNDDEYIAEKETDAGAGYAHTDHDALTASGTVHGDANADCGGSVDVFVTSSANRRATGESGSIDVTFLVTFSTPDSGPTPSPSGNTCDGLEGSVRDGGGADPHANYLPRIRVQLLRSGSPVGAPVTTDDNGLYCIRTGESIQPGEYDVRATLVDAAHDPPIFETHYGAAPEPASRTVHVTAEDFDAPGGGDIDFTGVEDQPWLSDVAVVHWQTERFVRWLLDNLGLSVGQLGHFSVQSYAEGGTRYNQTTKVAFIDDDGTDSSDSIYADRAGPLDECPENCEWHEIGHHVAHQLDIANTLTALPCMNRAAHGGWLNLSTCDSVQEGFPSFLATLASMDIDAQLADFGFEGYATDAYSVFGSLEDNGFRPWTMYSETVGREDFAVSQLLWDLADENEAVADTEIVSVRIQATGAHFGVDMGDNVALGGVPLVHIMAAAQVSTVADLYDALVASPDVPASLKAPTLDLEDDGSPDVSPLDEVFLMHGFHAVFDPGTPRFEFGTPVSRTDHVPSVPTLVERRHAPLTPGSAIRLTNPTSAAVTAHVSIAYPHTTSRFDVVVAANGAELVHVELPPYWPGVLADGAPLPACGAEGQRLITLTVTASGIAPWSVDSCAFIQAIPATAEASAFDVQVGAIDAAGQASPPTSAGSSAPARSASCPSSEHRDARGRPRRRASAAGGGEGAGAEPDARCRIGVVVPRRRGPPNRRAPTRPSGRDRWRSCRSSRGHPRSAPDVRGVVDRLAEDRGPGVDGAIGLGCATGTSGSVAWARSRASNPASRAPSSVSWAADAGASSSAGRGTPSSLLMYPPAAFTRWARIRPADHSLFGAVSARALSGWPMRRPMRAAFAHAMWRSSRSRVGSAVGSDMRVEASVTGRR